MSKLGRWRSLRWIAGLGMAAWLGCNAAPPPLRLDLTELLTLAELSAETRRVEFGTPEGRAYLLEGWSDNPSARGARRFIWSEGERSELRLVIGEPRDLELRFRCWPFSIEGAPPQTLSLSLSGQPLGQWELEDRPRWYAVGVPAAMLVPGENLLEFRYGHQYRPRDVLPGSDDDRPLAVAWEELRVVDAVDHGLPERRNGSAGPSLRLPPRTAVAYYLMLPEGGQLEVAGITGWAVEGAAPAADAHLQVEVQAAESDQPLVFRLEPGAAPQALELAPQPGVPSRITLRAMGGAETGLDLLRPTLRVAGVAPEAQAPAPPRTPMPIVFYVVDTLRADHLSAYGYPRPTSPAIEAFARDAVLFESAVAQASWTRPAVASLLSGLNPQRHGVRRRNAALSEDLPLLPELLRELGYRTLAVVTNGNISEGFGFGRGFDEFRYLPEVVPDEVHQLSDRVDEVALEWLASRDDGQPFFLYLHTTDPHVPYTPRPPFRERFAAAVKDPFIGTLRHMREVAHGESLGRHTVDELRALYDGEVAFNDASFGALLAGLRKLGLYDESLIVLVSDHGEAFAEHGSFQHGTTLYEEELHVPLLIKLPGEAGGGRVVESIARQVDLLPTVLDLLGQPAPAESDGRSLLPLLEGREPVGPEVTAFSHLGRRRGQWESARHQAWKLIRTRADAGGAERVSLYRLDDDPGEKHNLAAEYPVWRGYLLSQLRHLESETSAGREGPSPTQDPELRERLEALGYL